MFCLSIFCTLSDRYVLSKTRILKSKTDYSCVKVTPYITFTFCSTYALPMTQIPNSLNHIFLCKGAWFESKIKYEEVT